MIEIMIGIILAPFVWVASCVLLVFAYVFIQYLVDCHRVKKIDKKNGFNRNQK